ncbi:DUF2182 domain-containing protein [Oricola cellulosilytica]|uniref:DUF2182 domain-containing protein n=2 Tax=Oricola cellulosilytica TaxID=1429082 RepID=A0A4R0PBF8_9HYPH|nr:DUF2182 domain-containing protein [Oricola cellulosilytica]
MPATGKPIHGEGSVRQDRMRVATAIAVLVAFAAVYTIAGVGTNMSALDMTFGRGMHAGEGMGAMALGVPGGWGGAKFALVFLMWWLMMIAMMLPSAAPTILLYTALLRHLPDTAERRVRSGAFMAGYLAAWALFSLWATAAQWWFEAASLISPAKMAFTEGIAAQLLLIAVGAYQFHPLKVRCLAQCRTPSDLIARQYRPGISGAAQAGFRHGAFCLGCCTALMALLFVGGIMNLFWIFGLAALVALEKSAPCGRFIGRAVGAGLCGLGIAGLGLLAVS